MAIKEYSTTTLNFTNQYLSEMVDNGKLVVETAIQRGKVWNTYQRSLLIHSMITGIFIPPIILVKMAGEDKYETVDGRQRIESVVSFVKGDYKLHKSTPAIESIKGRPYEVAGLSYVNLPEEVRIKFDTVKLFITAYEDIKTNEEKSQIFLRMNNGTPLSSLEKMVAQAVSQKPIDDLKNHPIFDEVYTKAALRKLSQRNIIIRSYAAMLGDSSAMEAKSLASFIHSEKISSKDTKRLSSTYDNLLDICDSIAASEGDEHENKVISQRILKKNCHFIAAITLMLNHEEEDVGGFLKYFFSGKDGLASINDEYNASISGGMWKKPNVEKRNQVMEEEYNSFRG